MRPADGVSTPRPGTRMREICIAMKRRPEAPAAVPAPPPAPVSAEPAERAEDVMEHDVAGPFFRRVDWSAFWTVFLVVLGVYTYTLAPTVTLEDSGELAVAADYLGVPHPPGYPIWTLLSWAFQWIFHWVEFNGHPNPAWGVAFSSAFFGALACALLAMLVSRSGNDVLQGIARFSGAAASRDDHRFCWAGGVAGGLLLAFSPCMWSQSVIVEVYSLNTFFQSLVVLLLYRWMVRPHETGVLQLMAFIFALGLTNHQTLMFMGGAIALVLLARDPELFRDFLIAGVLLAFPLGFTILNGTPETARYAYSWLSGPAHPGFWIHSALFLAIPLVLWPLLPRGRTVAATILLFYLGLSFYAYLPFAAEQNPPMNWAYPRTWEGFLHAIGRGQYERVTLPDIFSAKLLQQIVIYFSDLRRQFTLPIAAVGFLPFAAWSVTVRGRRFSLFYPALVLAAALLGIVGLETLLQDPGSPQDRALEWIYKSCMLAIFLLAGVGLGAALTRFLGDLTDRARAFFASRSAGGFFAGSVLFLLLAVLALVALGVVVLFLRHLVFADNIRPLERAAAAALFLLPFPALAAIAALRQGPLRLDLDVIPSLQRWLLATMVGFLSVSLLYIVLLNQTLDLQTLFIARVQFIQSHALFALWLGYGLLVSLAFLNHLFHRRAALKWLAIAAALATPALLVYRNARDPELERIYGGAEQHGHTFGWQFGHWQLRGVHGIREDLEADLPRDVFEKEWAAFPTPDYPPEMTPNAIFFGGTDPGRFVPTYMIFSAKVRPDVYLITQNALADATYLNIMRDLYGDRIWVPGAVDSNLAFSKYYEDVRTGAIDPGANVVTKDGRMSVQGVQGVMHINGILARMMFDRNKHAHDFYVEESYVIPWMYPYLTPHGLIMKLNAEPTAITDAMVADDRAFWDWYTRRLTANPKFVRDVVARKTFSKLRGAIAGLYAARGRMEDAEYALRQSVELYPLSPEACFRLAELLSQTGRIDDAIRQISDLLVEDPANDKVAGYLKHLEMIKRMTARRVELLARARVAPLPFMENVELMELEYRMGNAAEYERLFRQLLSANPPAQVLQRMALSAISLRDPALIEAVLHRYVPLMPDDYGASIELAASQLALGKPDAALATLQAALPRGGDALRERLLHDERFAPLATRPEFRALMRSPRARPPSAPLPDALRGLIR